MIKFTYDGIFEEILDQLGQMPLPPYITHQLKDKNRYQTVYAKHDGSAAAPTAGLHFTPELLQAIKDKGVNIAHVTLHVGLGTFRPVKVENIKEHHMHSEFYMVEEDQAKLINETKTEGWADYRSGHYQLPYPGIRYRRGWNLKSRKRLDGDLHLSGISI